MNKSANHFHITLSHLCLSHLNLLTHLSASHRNTQPPPPPHTHTQVISSQKQRVCRRTRLHKETSGSRIQNSRMIYLFSPLSPSSIHTFVMRHLYVFFFLPFTLICHSLELSIAAFLHYVGFRNAPPTAALGRRDGWVKRRRGRRWADAPTHQHATNTNTLFSPSLGRISKVQMKRNDSKLVFINAAFWL